MNGKKVSAIADNAPRSVVNVNKITLMWAVSVTKAEF